MSLWVLSALLASLPSHPIFAQSAPPKLAIVVDLKDGAAQALINDLSKEFNTGARPSVYELSRIDIANPIEKGKLVSSLESRDLVISIGDDATGFVSRELEDTRVYFVGAGLVAGDWLASKLTAGTFSFNVDRLLDGVERFRPGTMGIVYTPGYEPVIEWVRAGARQRGIALREKRISSLKELAPAVRDLIENTRTIWVAGDPMLVRGAGFEFLAERALSLRLPVIAPGLWEVQHGAFLAFKPEANALAARASATIVSSLRRDQTGPRFEPAPDGTLLVNEILAQKWKITLPPELRWRTTH